MSGNRTIFFVQDGVKEPIAHGIWAEGKLKSKLQSCAVKKVEKRILTALDCIGKAVAVLR